MKEESYCQECGFLLDTLNEELCEDCLKHIEVEDGDD